MPSINLRTGRLTATIAAAGVAVVVAACGSAARPKSGASGSGAHAPATASSATVKTARSPLGTYLVGPSGRALYLWVADSKNKSRCSGACASVWPPLAAKDGPTAAGGVQASLLGTINGPGGHKQITYHGHPLYYYAADSHAGTTAGQGSDGFGAKWWLVSAAGAAITGKNAGTGGGASARSSGSSTGSGSSSY